MVTQSLVLERSLGRLKARKEKLFLTCSFYHNLIVKVGVLHLLCSCCSCCFMLGSCLCYCGFHWNACMYVGYAWEGLNHVFLNGFPSCFT